MLNKLQKKDGFMEKFQPWEMIHCCHGRKWLQTRRAPQAQGDSTRLPYIFYHHWCAHNPHNESILPGATLLRSHVRLDKRTEFLQLGPNEGGKCQPVQFSTCFCVFVWADLVVSQKSLEGSVSTDRHPQHRFHQLWIRTREELPWAPPT